MDRFLDPLLYTLIFAGFLLSLILGIFEAARTWGQREEGQRAHQGASDEEESHHGA